MIRKSILAIAVLSALTVSAQGYAAPGVDLEGLVTKLDPMVHENKKNIQANKDAIASQQEQIGAIGQLAGSLDIMAHENKENIQTNKENIQANKDAIESQGEHLQGLNDIVMSEQHKRVENTANIAANTATNIKQEAAIQNNAAAIQNNAAAIRNNYEEMKNKFAAVNSRIDNLDEEMQKGFASQAALSGLFQPYNVGKFNLSVALGGYESEQAMALGTGYRFNENFAMKAGVATDVGGFDHVTYNIGANFEW